MPKPFEDLTDEEIRIIATFGTEEGADIRWIFTNYIHLMLHCHDQESIDACREYLKEIE